MAEVNPVAGVVIKVVFPVVINEPLSKVNVVRAMIRRLQVAVLEIDINLSEVVLEAWFELVISPFVGAVQPGVLSRLLVSGYRLDLGRLLVLDLVHLAVEEPLSLFQCVVIHVSIVAFYK